MAHECSQLCVLRILEDGRTVALNRIQHQLGNGGGSWWSKVQGGEDDVIPVAFSVCSCHGNKLNSAAEPIWLWSVDLVSVVCGNATADG